MNGWKAIASVVVSALLWSGTGGGAAARADEASGGASSSQFGKLEWWYWPTTTVAPAPTTTTTTTTRAPAVTTTTAAPNPASSSVVNLAWFYRPPANLTLPLLAANFGTYILNRNDEALRDSLRSLGESGPILQYVLANEIVDPGSATAQPWLNQVAWKPGDFASISREHPDWFLLDGSGQRISNGGSGFTWYFMDPANAGWQQFWASRVREARQSFGWKGVFADNVEMSLGKFARDGQLPARYPSDASLQTAVVSFLAAVAPEIRAAGPLWANLIEYDGDLAVLDRYLDHLDGAMDEGFAVDWDTGYLSPAGWRRSLQRSERALARGKAAMMVAQGPQADAARQQFSFASYLLTAGSSNASFRYTHYDAYRSAWLYPNYQIGLGQPLGPLYQVGSEWRRDYAGGRVSVDPLNRTSSITLI